MYWNGNIVSWPSSMQASRYNTLYAPLTSFNGIMSFSGVSLEDLIESVFSDNLYRIAIRRKFILEHTLPKFRCVIELSKCLRVTFVGEPAIDDGVPMR
jgi:hypothetical protein